MKNITAIALSFTFVTLLITTSSGGSPPKFKTTKGIESKGVSDGINGTLVFDKPIGGLISISLLSKKETIIRVPNESYGIVNATSGVDDNGRIAIIESHRKQHFLKIYDTNGQELSTVFEKPINAPYFKYLSLSPVNGYVAHVVNRETSVVGKGNSREILYYGELEIWDTKTKKKLSIKHDALDKGLSWLPDGKHLVFVDLIDRKESIELFRKNNFPKDLVQDIFRSKKYAGNYKTWPKVPVVSIINVETGDVRRLFRGWRPIVSENGKQILAGNANNWTVYNLDGNFVKFTRPPGIMYNGAVAFNQTHILYWGLPTEGSELRSNNRNSLAGPRQMYTLKVAEFETNRFETVIPFIDYRRRVGFGKFLTNED